MDKYTELEKQAQKFLDETDTMQFSTVELLTMFYNQQEQLNLTDVVASKRFTKTDLLRAYKAGCIENHEGVPITSMEDFGEISKNALEWVKRYTE